MLYAYLVIVDPLSCSHAKWQELCGGIKELACEETCYLLMADSLYSEAIPRLNLIPAPTTK